VPRVSTRAEPTAKCSVGLFSSAALRGRARCVLSGTSAAVAIAAWLGRALAVGVRKILGGLDG